MKQLLLIIGLFIWGLGSVIGQTEGEPDINAFIYADVEPKPLNLGEVRQRIGYPESAIEQNIQGSVVIRMLVDEAGAYVRHKVIGQADPVLAEAVENHVAELQFSPAIVDEKPIKFWVNIPFNFKLVDEREENLKAEIDSLTTLIADDPENYEYYHQRGVNYSQIGKNDEALADLNQSLALNPRKNKKKAAKNTYPYLIYSHYSRAAVQVEKEAYGEALPDYDQSLLLMDEMKVVDSAVTAMRPLVYLERGYTHMMNDDYASARRDFRWVLKNDTSQKCTVYSLLADMGIADSSYDELSWVYEGLIECDPENNYLWYSKGYYELQGEDYASAIEDFNETVERNQNILIKIAAYNHMAKAYMELGQPEEAEAAIDGALRVNALNPQSYYFRGLLREKAGSMEEACADWTRAMEFGLGEEDGKACLAKLDEHCGGWEE